MNDMIHCGGCSNPCYDGANCVDGKCEIPSKTRCQKMNPGQGDAPFKSCGQGSDNCVNTDNDNEHCGECDNKCGAGSNCVQGKCVA
jgi:hypothetical protein